MTEEGENILLSLGNKMPIDIADTALGPAEEAHNKQKEADFTNYVYESKNEHSELQDFKKQIRPKYPVSTT